MTIVWRVICRTVFCAVLYTTIIHNGMYTHMSSVYRCPSVYRFNFCAFCVYFLNTVSLFVLGLVFLSCCVSYVCEIQHNEWQNVLLGLSPSPQKGWLYTMALSFCLSVRFLFVSSFVRLSPKRTGRALAWLPSTPLGRSGRWRRDLSCRPLGPYWLVTT